MSAGETWDYVVYLSGLWGALLSTVLIVSCLLLCTSCGHLPPHWCRIEPIPIETVGTPQIRHCDEETCEAVRGEWTVDDVWMFDMARVLYECGEGAE